MIDTKALRMSQQADPARVESLHVLCLFRTDFYVCLSARGDALFELTDALLCTDGPVRAPVGLVLAPEHRRGHGAMYHALNRGCSGCSATSTAAARTRRR
jgi:DDE superfamily endonuclease